MTKMKLKTGSLVKVISGGFYGIIDNISRIEPKKNRVYLKKAFRKQYDKSPGNKKKSEQKEVLIPIHISNITYWSDEKKKVTKTGLLKK